MTPATGYGTVPNSTNGLRSDANGNVDEEQTLLVHPPPTSRWRQNLVVDVHRDRADIVLLLCYTITGLLDSASISTWGSFVSMQTGMLPYLGLPGRADTGTSMPRKHRLHWSWLSGTVRIQTLDQIRTLSHILLRWLLLLQPLPSLLLSQPALGPLRLLLAADGVYHRRGGYPHLCSGLP